MAFENIPFLEFPLIPFGCYENHNKIITTKEPFYKKELVEVKEEKNIKRA